MGSTGLRNLNDNFTLSISDANHEKGFRAFRNSSGGRAYFNNDKNKEEEGNIVQEIRKLNK